MAGEYFPIISWILFFYFCNVSILYSFRYMVTEIGARDLGDPSRYNLLEVSVHLTCLQRKKVDKKNEVFISYHFSP